MYLLPGATGEVLITANIQLAKVQNAHSLDCSIVAKVGAWLFRAVFSSRAIQSF